MQHIGEANSTNFKNRDLYAGEAKEEKKKKRNWAFDTKKD